MNQYQTADTPANCGRWHCSYCGGFVSPHSQTCNNCGRYVGF